jgi:hypothetical protein
LQQYCNNIIATQYKVSAIKRMTFRIMHCNLAHTCRQQSSQLLHPRNGGDDTWLGFAA